MKRTTFFWLLPFLLGSYCAHAQVLHNKGAVISIQQPGIADAAVAANATLFIRGGLTNDVNGANIGEIINNGEIQLTGDWYQNNGAKLSSTGDEVFMGATNGTPDAIYNKYLQRISSNSDTGFVGNDFDFNNLIIHKPTRSFSNPSIVELAVNVEVASSLKWTSTGGVLRTDTIGRGDAGEDYQYEIYLKNPSPTALSGYSTTVGATNLFVEGKLRRQVNTAASYYFPIGVDPFHSIGGMNAVKIDFTATPTNSGILAFLESTNLFPLNNNIIYSDIGKHPLAPSPQTFNACIGGPDGRTDQIVLNLNQNYQWNITANTAGTFDYDLEVFPTNNCLASAFGDTIPSACAAPFNGMRMIWLAHNGHPLGVATTSVPVDWPGAPAGYMIDPVANFKLITGQSGFSIFRFHGTEIDYTTLPVELLYFTASNQACKVLLSFGTASEFNNDFFTIYRSSNARDWENIGRLNGNGSSAISQHYQFIDESPLSGTVYYRLTQTDYDGTTKTFPIIAVDMNGCGDKSWSIFPNPTTDHFNVFMSQPVGVGPIQILTIYDAAGAVHFRQRLLDQSTRVDVSKLAAGVYFVNLQSDQITDTKPIVITR
jgi:hypothetical protein